MVAKLTLALLFAVTARPLPPCPISVCRKEADVCEVLIAANKSLGPYCVIDGLAVNCYVEPVYTLDAGPVVIAASLPKLTAHLQAQGFKTEIPVANIGFSSPLTNGTRHSRPDRWMLASWESE
jgi:hypothetical protein